MVSLVVASRGVQIRIRDPQIEESKAVDVEVVEIEVGSWDKDLNAFKFEKFSDTWLEVMGLGES